MKLLFSLLAICTFLSGCLLNNRVVEKDLGKVAPLQLVDMHEHLPNSRDISSFELNGETINLLPNRLLLVPQLSNGHYTLTATDNRIQIFVDFEIEEKENTDTFKLAAAFNELFQTFSTYPSRDVKSHCTCSKTYQDSILQTANILDEAFKDIDLLDFIETFRLFENHRFWAPIQNTNFYYSGGGGYSRDPFELHETLVRNINRLSPYLDNVRPLASEFELNPNLYTNAIQIRTLINYSLLFNYLRESQELLQFINSPYGLVAYKSIGHIELEEDFFYSDRLQQLLATITHSTPNLNTSEGERLARRMIILLDAHENLMEHGLISERNSHLKLDCQLKYEQEFSVIFESNSNIKIWGSPSPKGDTTFIESHRDGYLHRFVTFSDSFNGPLYFQYQYLDTTRIDTLNPIKIIHRKANGRYGEMNPVAKGSKQITTQVRSLINLTVSFSSDINPYAAVPVSWFIDNVYQNKTITNIDGITDNSFTFSEPGTYVVKAMGGEYEFEEPSQWFEFVEFEIKVE